MFLFAGGVGAANLRRQLHQGKDGGTGDIAWICLDEIVCGFFVIFYIYIIVIFLKYNNFILFYSAEGFFAARQFVIKNISFG